MQFLSCHVSVYAAENESIFFSQCWICVVWTVNQTCFALPHCLGHCMHVCMRHAWSFRHLAITLSNANFMSRSSFFSYRSKIALEASQALYLLISGKNMSCLSTSMGEVYSQFRDPDGFLYITYASQDMFGWKDPPKWPCDTQTTSHNSRLMPFWDHNSLLLLNEDSHCALKTTQSTNHTWLRGLFWPHF